VLDELRDHVPDVPLAEEEENDSIEHSSWIDRTWIRVSPHIGFPSAIRTTGRRISSRMPRRLGWLAYVAGEHAPHHLPRREVDRVAEISVKRGWPTKETTRV